MGKFFDFSSHCCFFVIPREEKDADFGNHLQLGNPLFIALLSGRSGRAEQQISIIIHEQRYNMARQSNKKDIELLNKI